MGLIAWRGDRLRSPGRHRRAAQPRGGLPRQQPALRRLRLRGPARDGVPAALRGARRAGDGGRPVLQPPGHPHRPRPAVPHGGGPGPALAEDHVGGAAWAPGRPGRRRRAVVVVCVRGRGSAASRRCWRSVWARSPRPRPPGPWCCRCAAPGGRAGRRRAAGPGGGRVAGPGRSGQRRHGRPHRSGGHRRRPGRGHLLRPPWGGGAAPGARRPASTGTPSTSSAPGTVRDRRRHGHRGGAAGRRRRHVHSGGHPVRPATPGRRHAGHRLGLPRRRLSDHRRHPGRPARGDVRGGRAAAGVWLWVGGVLIVVGSVLAAVPGRRRRPTDPVSSARSHPARAIPSTTGPGPGPTAGPTAAPGAGTRPVGAAVGSGTGG